MRRANKTIKKAHSHSHARSYFGELDAVVVIDWLNSPRRPSNDPVAELLRLNSQLPILTTQHQVGVYLARLVRRTRLAVAPVLKSATPNLWSIDWKLVGNMDASQGLAVVRLLHLADQGIIGRIRQCGKKECGFWFYAKFEHQRFHSKKCQQQAFKMSPTEKARRAAYMRQLRHGKKLQERQWLRSRRKEKR